MPRSEVIVLGNAGNYEEYLFDRRDRRFHIINMGYIDEKLESFDRLDEMLIVVMTDQRVL